MLHTLRGASHYYAEELHKAIEEYKISAEICPDAGILNNLGAAYDDTEDFTQALSSYEAALRINPFFAVAYYNIANTYHSLNQYDEAITNYGKAIELQPNYIDAFNNRGISHRSAGKYDDAVLDFTHTLTYGGEEGGVYNNRGTAHFDRANYTLALADFSKAVCLEQTATHFRNRALTFKKLELTEQSDADSKRAKTMDNPWLLLLCSDCEQESKPCEHFSVASSLRFKCINKIAENGGESGVDKKRKKESEKSNDYSNNGTTTAATITKPSRLPLHLHEELDHVIQLYQYVQ